MSKQLETHCIKCGKRKKPLYTNTVKEGAICSECNLEYLKATRQGAYGSLIYDGHVIYEGMTGHTFNGEPCLNQVDAAHRVYLFKKQQTEIELQKKINSKPKQLNLF